MPGVGPQQSSAVLSILPRCHQNGDSIQRWHLARLEHQRAISPARGPQDSAATSARGDRHKFALSALLYSAEVKHEPVDHSHKHGQTGVLILGLYSRKQVDFLDKAGHMAVEH